MDYLERDFFGAENTHLFQQTSLTIPDVSYVVDTGRQKCRNYHAGTGVASYDIMWISKASANQRAGETLCIFMALNLMQQYIF